MIKNDELFNIVIQLGLQIQPKRSMILVDLFAKYSNRFVMF